MLGATIGNHVYLDTVNIFEPDLVSIEDHSSMAPFSCLSPHQLSRSTIDHAYLHVGKRCTIGSRACVHGRDVLEDDTKLTASSMGFIRKRMNGGTWSGYPAKKTGSVQQPRTPSQPAWSALLDHPMAGIRGLFWWAFLTLDRHIRSRTLQFRQSHNPDSSMPNHFRGVLKSNKLPIKFRLDCGQWSRTLRSLKIGCWHLCGFERLFFPGYSWCCWATYHLAFNERLTTAAGQLSFGWWSNPDRLCQCVCAGKATLGLWDTVGFEGIRRTRSSCRWRPSNKLKCMLILDLYISTTETLM
jgi:hypothetical protein